MKKIYNHLITSILLLLCANNVGATETSTLAPALCNLFPDFCFSFEKKNDNTILEKVKNLVNEENTSIKGFNNEKKNLLHLACYKGNDDIVKWLIEEKKVFENKLFAKDAVDNEGNGYLALTIKAYAEEDKKLALLKYFLKLGVPLGQITKNKQNLLHLACVQENYDIIKWLIETQKVFQNGILKKDAVDNEEYGYLALAIPTHIIYDNDKKQKKSLEIFKYLVEQGVPVNKRRDINEGYNLLQKACSVGNLFIVKFLIEEQNFLELEEEEVLSQEEEKMLDFEEDNLDILPIFRQPKQCNESYFELAMKYEERVGLIRYLAQKKLCFVTDACTNEKLLLVLDEDDTISKTKYDQDLQQANQEKKDLQTALDKAKKGTIHWGQALLLGGLCAVVFFLIGVQFSSSQEQQPMLDVYHQSYYLDEEDDFEEDEEELYG